METKISSEKRTIKHVDTDNWFTVSLSWEGPSPPGWHPSTPTPTPPWDPHASGALHRRLFPCMPLPALWACLVHGSEVDSVLAEGLTQCNPDPWGPASSAASWNSAQDKRQQCSHQQQDIPWRL